MSPARPNDTATSSELSLRAWAAEAEAAAGIARILAPTPFVPDSLRRWTNPEARAADRILDLDGTVATVTAVLLAGQELRLPPMVSLRSFTLIKGTVAMYAIAARGLLQNAGHDIVIKESTSQRAVVDGRRAGGEWQRAVWDLDRAKVAGLYPGHPEGNWRKQTKAMLVARATAEVSRWVAADALMGIPAMVEELDDEPRLLAIESASTEPRTTDPAEINGQPTTPRTTRRRTTQTRRALPSGPPSAPPPPPPEPPPEHPPRPAAPAAAKVEPRLTRPQQTRIIKGLESIGITSADEALGLIAAWVSHPVKGTGDLTPEEAVAVIERIEALLTIAAKPDDGQADTPSTEGTPPDAEPDHG